MMKKFRIVFGGVILTAAGCCFSADAAMAGDYDFAYASLERAHATVQYGILKLAKNGEADFSYWESTAADPVPARAETSPYAPRIEGDNSPLADRGAKVLVHPSAFRGRLHRLSGQWWEIPEGACLRLGSRPPVLLKRTTEKTDGDWGWILRSEPVGRSCQSAGEGASKPEIVALASERVFDTSAGTLKIRQQRFAGLLFRLNGWDADCQLSLAEKTSLRFTPDVFKPVGKDIWRSSLMEPQKKGGDMAVLGYVAISDVIKPIGRLVFMDVGHDFNRNGRIDDDWGHIYAGFPIVSRRGELGGFLLVDTSPVGLRDVPYTKGCTVPGQVQLTHTLGLILYLSEELRPDYATR